MQLPSSFIKQIEQQLGEITPLFLETLQGEAPVSLHFNPYKSENPKKENFNGVKWYSNGVYLKERPKFTLDPLFHAGQYYVQEASSMFVAEAVKQTCDLSKPLRVLDLAAAPGGKSTLLASVLHPESYILCNEVIKSRFKILEYNLIKWGTANTHVSNHDSKDFSKLKGFFDVILLDAPCSGEGLFRKDKEAVGHWSPEHVSFCAVRQRRILKNVVELLKPGGRLIYSTCTYNLEENDHNAQWLEEEHHLEHLPLDYPDDWKITQRTIGYQFYPHLTNGEGFYIACFQKEAGKENSFKIKSNSRPTTLNADERKEIANWINSPEDLFIYKDKFDNVRAILNTQLHSHKIVQNSLQRYIPGTWLGTFKKKNFVPSAELALSQLLKEEIASIEVDRITALKFLKKEIPPFEKILEGWAVIKYEGQHLGWIKGIKNRINNYYPKEWRIRMEIPSE